MTDPERRDDEGHHQAPIHPLKYLSNRIDANEIKIEKLGSDLDAKFERMVYPIYGVLLLLMLYLFFR
jgi:hypothetical protein